MRPSAFEYSCASSAQLLKELFLRRGVAKILEVVAHRLYEQTGTTSALVTEMEKSLAGIRTVLSEPQGCPLLWVSDLLPTVLREAEEKEHRRRQTGRPVIGVRTGIEGLDQILNGLNAGLCLLAGGPAIGKTTLALQIASAACADVPTIFVTFENSPGNLVLKAICSCAQVNTQDVERGTADLKKLTTAAGHWDRDAAQRLAFVEGKAGLSVTQLRSHVHHAINRYKGTQCLVVVDFLQVWAKIASSNRGLDTRGRVEALGSELRELAIESNCPIVAISSQNREQGGYGEGNGRASLDSLKESGDLEYLADVAMFLVGTSTRQSTPPTRALELIVQKNRIGETGTVHLIFKPDISKFREEVRNVRD